MMLHANRQLSHYIIASTHVREAWYLILVGSWFITSSMTTTTTTVKVLAGKALKSMDLNGLSDPFCVLGEADPVSGKFIDVNKCVRSEVCCLVLCLEEECFFGCTLFISSFFFLMNLFIPPQTSWWTL